jgi:hypothetical protein
LALERLSNRYGVTKREMLERLIVAEDKRILSGIELDSPEWENSSKFSSLGYTYPQVSP